MLANAIGGETFLVGNGAAFSGGAVNLPADTNGVLAGTYDGATAIARLNGAAGTSSAVSVSGGGAASALGKAQDFAGSFFNGRIYQVIVRAGATSALELAGIEAYVASKSGVTL